MVQQVTRGPLLRETTDSNHKQKDKAELNQHYCQDKSISKTEMGSCLAYLFFPGATESMVKRGSNTRKKKPSLNPLFAQMKSSIECAIQSVQQEFQG